MPNARQQNERDSASPVPLLPLAGTGIVVLGCCLVVGGMLLYGAAEFRRVVAPLREARRAAGAPAVNGSVRYDVPVRETQSNLQGGPGGSEVRNR